MKTYTGGCHCKRVRYELELDLSGVAIECNCSHCQMKGLVLMFTSPEKFSLTSGEGDMETYLFNKQVIEHLFCPVCGVEPFGRGKNPDGSPAIAVNLRTIDDIDLSTLTRVPYNGKDL